MTVYDFLSLTPFIIIAVAPIIIMIVISILRNYNVVYSFSIISLFFAFISLFFIIQYLPHKVESLLIIDFYGLFFLGIIILSALFVVLLSYDYIKQLEGVREEYYIIIFTSTLGALLLAIANHFVIFFLGLETLSISLYILIGFQRAKDYSIEAGIKYLILASVSTAFLLFGMALIYLACGSMNFYEIANSLTGKMVLSPLILTGFGMIMVGVGFKLALVPFHMWIPDVYQGAPVPVTTYIATVSKGAVMAVLIRFFFSIKGFENYYLFVIISSIAILSMFIGNLLAIRQKNIKRLMAYSSIANMGYLIIILLTGSNNGIQASVFYLISYVITSIGVFGVISLISSSKNEAEMIDYYKGFFWRKPWLAIVLTISLLSLAGIPITAGFIAKFYVVFESMKSGLLILVFALVVNSVIGLYYYLRIITKLFSPIIETELPSLSFTGKFTLSIITICILILGVYPGWLIDLIVNFVKL